MTRADAVTVDVAVAGGGLAGLATAIHLARRGKHVVCIEPRGWPHDSVGESLEFSAPKLLENLGIDLTTAGQQRHLYPKTSVRAVGADTEFTVWPPRWWAGPPIWCSRLAFHTDRRELDRQLRDLAIKSGVVLLPERVTDVHHSFDRVTALITNHGTTIGAGWYVDASGHTVRLFGRALGLDRRLLGQRRAAYWTRVSESPTGHATVLHFPEPEIDDLMWAWEIPLNDREISVGVVMSAARSSALRADGLGPRDIFGRQLVAIPRLRSVIAEHADAHLQATTYTPFEHVRTVGDNWLLVGDAAAMADPLTSNGVTSALRYARQAADLVSDNLDHQGLDRRRANAFERTTSGVVATLDRAIEAFVYEPAIRRRHGLRWAVNLYAATGVITNALYAKLNPSGSMRSRACAAMLAASRAWTIAASSTFSRLGKDRATRPDSQRSSGPSPALPLRERHTVIITKGEPLGAPR